MRAAAVTADGARTGVVVERVEIVEPGRDLWVGTPMLLGVHAGDRDEPSLHPTLRRIFEVGAPLAVQSEVAGRPVARGQATVTARLVASDGSPVREGGAALEPGRTKDRGRATVVVPTQGLPPGSYTLVWEARTATDNEVNRQAMPVTLIAAPSTARTRDSANAPLTTHSVAHGPASSFEQGGTHVIRTATEWQAFWRHLPTRQSPPEIDFDRVTLLGVVLDPADADERREPRVQSTRREPDARS